MQFIKYHWFGLLVSAAVLFFLVIFFLVLIAPHQDDQKRGFVPCTETMANEIHQCAGNKLCILEAIVGNTFCNVGVVGRGLSAWLGGEQPHPWSNYLFAPAAKTAEEPQAELNEFYNQNPDIEGQMQELQKLNDELEKEYGKRKASRLESE